MGKRFAAAGTRARSLREVSSNVLKNSHQILTIGDLDCLHVFCQRNTAPPFLGRGVFERQRAAKGQQITFAVLGVSRGD